jgi:RNA polymerase sigma-70 factor (ECF subfamily)
MGGLVDTFAEQCPRDTTAVDRTALAAALADTLAAARTRWPELAVDDTTAVRHLAVTWNPEGSETLLPAFAAELVLAAACLAGDAVAIRIFNKEMFERVDRVLSRLGINGPDADDVKQDVRTKLLVADNGDAKLALYHGTGPLAHWVASVAGREALGAIRKRKPTEAMADDDFLADASDDPQLQALKSRHGAEFKQAFQAAVAELEPRDRAILRALIVDDRSVNEIAMVYGIHRVTASRWVSEVRHNLLVRTRDQLKDRLALDASSLDSAVRMLDSNLELSLYRLLADTKT